MTWPKTISDAQAALFDLDGVLVDTAVLHHAAWQELATELGFLLTDEAAELTKGVSRMAALDIVLDAGTVTASGDDKLRWATRKNDRYKEMLDGISPADLLPGSLEFLHALGERGIKRALGSASANAPAILKHLQIADCFEAIVDGTVVKDAKPNPAVFIKGAELLGLPNATCVVYEDAAAGVKAAHAAGMHCIGIGTAANLPEADVLVPSLAFASINIFASKS
jgi:beta-phosphoglucomutase